MLTLLSLLQTRRDWPGYVLAGRLAISDRTLRRDVERLRELGYRVVADKGPEGGYRLEAGSELPPLLFEDDQAVAIAIALQQAASSGNADGESALRALHTVRQVMPARLRHRIDSLTFATLPAPRAAPVDPDVLLAVSGAVRASEVLRFDYAPVGSVPGDDSAAPTSAAVASRPRVEPYQVIAHQGRWYLVARDLDVAPRIAAPHREAPADDWRICRLDRMTPRWPTGPRFTPR